MRIISKHGIYQFTMLAWAVGVAGLVIVVPTGNAEPYISPTALPITTPLELFGTAGVLIVAGTLVLGQFEKRSWKRAGARANLTPAGRSLVGKPDLVGEIDGHTVRVRTTKRKTSGGGDEGSSQTTFTTVEAELASDADTGLVLGPADDAAFDFGSGDVDLSSRGDTIDGVAFVGDEALARGMITTRTADALQEPTQLDAAFAGDTDGLLLDAVPDPDGAIAGAVASRIKGGLAERLPGGPGTVSAEQRGVLLDPQELEAQAKAVAAVADSFDRVTAATEPN